MRKPAWASEFHSAVTEGPGKQGTGPHSLRSSGTPNDGVLCSSKRENIGCRANLVFPDVEFLSEVFSFFIFL